MLKARVSKYSGHLANQSLGEQLPAEERHRPTLKTTAVEPRSEIALGELQKIALGTIPTVPPQQMENESTHQTASSFLSPLPPPRAHSSPCLDPGTAAGRDRETPALSPDAPGLLRAPRSCLPGAAAPGAGAARLLLASAPSFSASPRTLSWAPSSETGPGCSRLPRRRLGRRCCRQRTPSGGWKPV